MIQALVRTVPIGMATSSEGQGARVALYVLVAMLGFAGLVRFVIALIARSSPENSPPPPYVSPPRSNVGRPDEHLRS